MIRNLLSAAFVFAYLGLFAQNTASYPADVVNDYFKHQLEMIRVTPGFTPPVASRSLGFSGLCAYEAVVHGIPERNSLAGMLPELSELPLPAIGQDYHWAEVANYALHDITANMYSNASVEDLDALETLRDEFTAAHLLGSNASIISASQTYGEDLAAEIIAYAATDGQEDCQFSNFPEDFTPVVGDGLWVPLEGQSALQPYWGEKRCFVVPNVTLDMVAEEPPVYSTETDSELYAEAMAVYEAVNNVTVEEQNIAEYWADGPGTYTPPGHSISMLRFILIDEEENLAFAAEAYARLGIGVADAFVQCWKTKYHYNLLRPVHYINDHIDADWNTIVDTPPFPEYTSGHSSQSGAFGAVMTGLYGPNYAFTDSTYGEAFGGPRSWDNFIESAEETAISRLYGGIHYPVGNNNGSSGGMMIGEMVNDLFDQVVSVPESSAITEVQIFPNPSSGTIQFTLPGNEVLEITVRSLQGQTVHTTSTRDKRLDLSHLSNGIYAISIQSESVQAQTMWIKQ